MKRGLGAITFALLTACRTQVSLGDPGATDAAQTGAACAAPSGTRVLVPLDDFWGEPRALAIDARFVYVAFANGAAPGKLARADVAGGALELVAALGVNPAKIVLDDTYAYVTCPGSGEVQRIDKESGAVVTAANQAGATAIAIDGHGRAYWTLPTSNQIAAWDFRTGLPTALLSTVAPVDLAINDGLLFIEGPHEIDALVLGGPAEPSRLADRCGSGAIGLDEVAVYCPEADRVVRIARASGEATVVATGQGALDGVLVGAGRAFWRARRPSGAYVMSAPLDGVGGPTIVSATSDPHAPWAIGRCNVFWVSGRTIVVRGV